MKLNVNQIPNQYKQCEIKFQPNTKTIFHRADYANFLPNSMASDTNEW